MNTVWLTSDGEGLVPALHAAVQHLDTAEGEVVLDFSGVERVDPRALRAMEEFVGSADGKAVTVVLCGVNIAVYKVLKLMRLASRFTFRA
jgi:anti-anti-sigma regulatory factor